MSGRSSHYEQWVAKALEDEFAAKEIIEGKQFPAPACFHAQQMVEKLLKALLVLSKRKFQKTHDLLLLATLLESFAPRVKKSRADLRLLNRYYVETRYPGDYPEFTVREAVAALAAARRVKDVVHGIVTQKMKKR